MGRKPKSTKVDSKSLKINKKSKTIQKSTNKIIETPLPKDWNSNLVLAKVFEHMKFKDLVNLNSVCRKWHQVINPMIYKSLKILRHRYVENKYHDKNLSKEDKLAAEVKECIYNNTKHNHLIQEFKLHARLPPTLAQEFFGTFCYLSKFTIFNIKTSQDILLTCLKPLKYLKELNLDKAIIEEIKRKKFVFESVELPLSLTKLRITYVSFIKDPKLIKQTLCSHTSLEEFVLKELDDPILLTPFNTQYPTIQKFTFIDQYHSSSVTHTYGVIESNHQLTQLHLESPDLNSHVVTLINSHLASLTELTMRGSKSREVDTSTDVRFTQPMKLTKLTLYWNDLTPASVDSILSNMPQLKDLHISVGYNYTPLTSIIRKRCKNLAQLTYNAIHDWLTQSTVDNLFDQFFLTEFAESQYQCNQTLQSLNFSHINLSKLKPEYLEQFTNLQMICFNQLGSFSNKEKIQELKLYLNQLNGWKLKLFKHTWSCCGFLYKPNCELTPINMENFEYWF